MKNEQSVICDVTLYAMNQSISIRLSSSTNELHVCVVAWYEKLKASFVKEAKFFETFLFCWQLLYLDAKGKGPVFILSHVVFPSILIIYLIVQQASKVANIFHDERPMQTNFCYFCNIMVSALNL